MDFWISQWISGFQFGFPDFSLDFCRQVSSCMFLDILVIEGVHVTSPGRQVLHISAYYRIRAAILKGNEQGKCMARPILRARFEVRSMHLASTL